MRRGRLGKADLHVHHLQSLLRRMPSTNEEVRDLPGVRKDAVF